jgi:hypothetical protein
LKNPRTTSSGDRIFPRNRELPPDFRVRVEAYAAVEVPDEPLFQIHDLRTASPFMPKFKLSASISLKRTTRLHPTWPFVKGLSEELPGDQGRVGGTGFQEQCFIHVVSDRAFSGLNRTR